MCDDGGINWDEDGGVREMSGHGAGCWIRCSVLTDDPGLVLNEGEVDTAPTQPALQGRELKARQWAGRYAW